jgi:hypothetical protein
MLEDVQGMSAAWASPAAATAAGSATVQQLTAVKHLLQPLVNAVSSQRADSATTGSSLLNPNSSSSSSTAASPQQQQYRRDLSGRQPACLADSALVSMLTSAEQQWLSWLLGQALAVAGGLLQQQGLPGSQQMLLQVLEVVAWAQQQQQQQQEPLVLLRQQLAAASAQQLQRLLRPWPLNPATAGMQDVHFQASSTAAAAAAGLPGSGSSSSSSSMHEPGAPNGGMTAEEMQRLTSACHTLAAAMNSAFYHTAADVARFTGVPLPKQLSSAASAGLTSAGSGAAAGFQRRAAAHAAAAPGQTAAATAAAAAAGQMPAGRIGSDSTQTPPCVTHGSGSSSSSSTRPGSFSTVPWEACYWPLALTAAAARYSVVRAALGDVFAACPGHSTATLTAVVRLLQQPLAMLEQQLMSLGLSVVELPGDAMQLEQQQQQQVAVKSIELSQDEPHQQHQQQQQLGAMDSISSMWRRVLNMRSGSFSSSSSIQPPPHSSSSTAGSSSSMTYSCSNPSDSDASALGGGGIGVTSVITGGWSLASYCRQQQQRLQQHQPFVVPTSSGQHSDPFVHQQQQQQHALQQRLSALESTGSLHSRLTSGSSGSVIMSFSSLHRQLLQQMAPPQPRLRAAAAEKCVELFPWDDLLLLQQHLWVGCCSAEVSHVLTQQLAVEPWTPFSAVLPVAGSAVELYRMLQAAVGAWAEVLLHAAPSAAAAAVGQCDLQHHGDAVGMQQQQQQHDEAEQQRQRQQQEQHCFQKRRQHGQMDDVSVQQNKQNQQQQQVQVSARSAALCRLMFGAVRQLQLQYLQHLLKSWDACCAGSSSSTAAAAGSGGLLLTHQLSVLLNSLLLMRQEAERLEGTLQQVTTLTWRWALVFVLAGNWLAGNVGPAGDGLLYRH